MKTSCHSFNCQKHNLWLCINFRNVLFFCNQWEQNTRSKSTEGADSNFMCTCIVCCGAKGSHNHGCVPMCHVPKAFYYIIMSKVTSPVSGSSSKSYRKIHTPWSPSLLNVYNCWMSLIACRSGFGVQVAHIFTESIKTPLIMRGIEVAFLSNELWPVDNSLLEWAAWGFIDVLTVREREQNENTFVCRRTSEKPLLYVSANDQVFHFYSTQRNRLN